MKRLFPAASLGLFAFAAVVFGSALSIEPTVSVAPTAKTNVQIFARREVVVLTPTPGPTQRPRATATSMANCRYMQRQQMVCAWPTPTMALPIPTCGAEETGLICVVSGPSYQSIHGMQTATPTATATATPVFGADQWAVHVRDDET